MTDAFAAVEDWLGSAPRSRVDYDVQAPHYDLLYGDADEGWPFWREALIGGKCVVEVGAGTGRLTALLSEVAQSVIAVEPASRMLDGARERLAGRQNVKLHRGSAVDLPVNDGAASHVIIPYGALNYLLSPTELLAAIREADRVLEPGGSLIVDVNYYPLGHPHSMGSTAVRYNGSIPLPQGRLDMFGGSVLDPDWNVCRYSEILDQLSEDGACRRSILHHDIHLFTPFELYFLLIAAGFDVVALYGGFDGQLPSGRSKRLIAVGTNRR